MSLPTRPCDAQFDHPVHIHKTTGEWARCFGDGDPGDPQAAVTMWHRRWGFAVAEWGPELPLPDIRADRARIFASEAAELIAELLHGLPDGIRLWELVVTEFERRSRPDPHTDPDLPRTAHEAGDVLYALVGLFVNYGFPMQQVFAAIHRANTTRVDVTGEPLVRDGKAVKGPRYKPPDMAAVLAAAGHRPG